MTAASSGIHQFMLAMRGGSGALLSGLVLMALGTGASSRVSGATASPAPSRQSVTADVASPSCSATSGGLTLRAKALRSAGISPLLVFFDATGTTSSAVAGNRTTFQDVSYGWNFGDPGPSGSTTWAYGSHAGKNSKNAATGAVAAHLYVTNGGDSLYPVTVTAHDGSNTVSCQLGVSAYDAAGPKGFPRKQTTCVYNSTAGSGCPAGANRLRSDSIGSALDSAFGSNKRVLFRCGDRFSGSYAIGTNVTKASIGAYGGCEDTASNRPIFQNSSGITIGFTPNNPTDIRIADIDFEDGTGSAQAISNGGGLGETQITLYNLNCNGMSACYYMNQATQSGIVQSAMTGMRTSTGTFWNFAGNNCLNGSRLGNCGGSPAYYNVNYNAILGNSLDGHGATTQPSGIETLRISACRLCVIANNTIKNANNVGAVLKLHSGNTWDSQPGWVGQFTEYIEISDNLFSGNSGAQQVELAPQNDKSDERIRYVVVERNLWNGQTGNSGGPGRQFLVGAVSVSVRSNVFYVAPGDTTPPEYSIEVARRGVEPIASAVEIFNNTCYALTTIAACVGFDPDSCCTAPALDSRAVNNLFYNNGGKHPVVVDRGVGNTVSGNATSSVANPLLVNASGSLSLISDFVPTQNYSGGAQVPVWYDALGVEWSPTWSLGALKPRAKNAAGGVH